MREEILKLKPESIFDVIPKEFFLEVGTHHDEYLKCGNYYEYYYGISKYYQPETILEIGVRYGYSLGSMIIGSDNVKKVVGIDCDDYVSNSLNVAEENIKKHVTKNLDYIFLNIDSHTINKFDEKYDLIHVDGDHTYDGKIKDLNLLKNSCKVAIIDDYIHLPQVRDAANDWIEENSTIISKVYLLDSIRGSLIIEFM